MRTGNSGRMTGYAEVIQQTNRDITSGLPTIQELRSFTRQCPVLQAVSGSRCDQTPHVDCLS